MYLEMSKHQGYVPPKCYHDGNIVWGAVNAGHDPCGTCDLDRTICEGRLQYKDRETKDEKQMNKSINLDDIDVCLQIIKTLWPEEAIKGLAQTMFIGSETDGRGPVGECNDPTKYMMKMKKKQS